MELLDLRKAQVQQKRIYTLLNEVLDLSGQLAQALDRNDQTTVQMLVSMRKEPILQLSQARLALLEQRDGLSEADRERFSALLNGAAAQTEAESPLAEQVQMNNRVLTRVLDLDKAINFKLTRTKNNA